MADELSAVDHRPADTADTTFQREMDQTVRRILEVEEEQLRQAVARRAAGQYGVCENCGRKRLALSLSKHAPFDRLRASLAGLDLFG